MIPRLCLLFAAVSTIAAAPRSHPPMRAIPQPTMRPLSDGSASFADPSNGDDAADGSRDKPWKTLAHALTKLKPGDTLVLRGGIYWESLTVTTAGAKDRPVTIRSHPGELAILDGGLREFHDDPTTAWAPAPGGAKGEYRSTKTYPARGRVCGHFADSMVPLHAYRNAIDLRSDNNYWTIKSKLEGETGVNCGPGLWFDAASGRIHCRLAHTDLDVIGEQNYKGETDPRKLPLSVGGAKPTLRLDGARHWRFQDLVLRGSSAATVLLDKVEDVTFDGVTIYGGAPALRATSTVGLKIIGSNLRGVSAPWSTRSYHKYRGTSAYLISALATNPPSRDWEIAHCELTDCHDGPYIGTVLGLRLHHCLIDNFDDDGVYLTAAGVGGDIDIHQNVLSRCLTTFAFHGSYPVGKGVRIYRNVFDLRGPVPYTMPARAGDPAFESAAVSGRREWNAHGRIAADHGSPTWEPIDFYHNTLVTADPAFRDYYLNGWGGHLARTRRRVFNNVFVQLTGQPGLNFDPTADLHADGNLHWSLKDGPTFRGDFFAKFRASPMFADSKKVYPAGWTTNDRYGDPKLTRLAADWRMPLDVRPLPGSPALDAGVVIPMDWPDPLRALDKGKPDIGALPHGAAMLRVGPVAQR